MVDVVLIDSKVYDKIRTKSSNSCAFFFVSLDPSQCSIELIELVFYAERYQNPIRYLRWKVLRNYLTAVFSKGAIVDVWKGSEYTSFKRNREHVFCWVAVVYSF